MKDNCSEIIAIKAIKEEKIETMNENSTIQYDACGHYQYAQINA